MSGMQPLISSILRCSVANTLVLGQRSISTCRGPLYLQVTPILSAEPLKKKKKADPAVVRAREEKKRKRIEKSIRQLQKYEGQLKPIQEAEVTVKLRQEMELRARPAPPQTEAESDARRLKEVQWMRYRYRQHLQEAAMLDRAVHAQHRALQELQRVSEGLWLAALEEDRSLFPFSSSGPLESLPIPGYHQPDGDFVDISKKWE